jgi:hypothetical protein
MKYTGFEFCVCSLCELVSYEKVCVASLCDAQHVLAGARALKSQAIQPALVATGLYDLCSYATPVVLELRRGRGVASVETQFCLQSYSGVKHGALASCSSTLQRGGLKVAP